MFVDKYETFILDIDGTILYGPKPIEGAAELLNFLYSKGKQICFLTNNSTDNATSIRRVLKTAGLNIHDTTPIVTASDLTSAYLREVYGKTRLIVLGTGSLQNRLAEDHVIDEVHPEFLVHGRHLDICYKDIKRGIAYLRSGARLVLTNIDLTQEYSGETNPETGLLAASLVRFTGKNFISPAKPSKFAFRYVMKKNNINPNFTVVIGDNLDTDIRGATDSGLDSVYFNHSGHTDYKNKPVRIIHCLSELLEI